MAKNREVKLLDLKTIKDIKNLYNNFKDRSLNDYKFELQPLEYEELGDCIQSKILKGLVLYENNTAVGLLIYTTALNEAVELNMIHCIDNEDINERRKALLRVFIDEVKNIKDWKVISYPMLGIQKTFVQNITHFGFKLIGQAVVKFSFNDTSSLTILKKSEVPELPEGYSISNWKPEYFDETSKVIHDTFKDASDSEFDPRFTTIEGSKDAVHKIVENIYGQFLPESTQVLLYKDKVEGICFVNLTAAEIANIPLTGIKQAHKNKGFGKLLLKRALQSTISQIANGKVMAHEINASVDTDNYPAFRMYRKVGFKEEYTYPHAYRKND